MSIILLSILLILLSIVSVTELLIYENRCILFLNLNQTFEALWIGLGNGLLIWMLRKISLLYLTIWITVMLLIWKQLGSFFQKNDLPRCWDYLCLQHLIGTLTFFLFLKLPPRKLEPYFALSSFFLLSMPCISKNL